MIDSFQPAMWKKIAIRSAFGGLAFAFALAIISGVAIWYYRRPEPPQPWNSKALKATFDMMEFTAGSSKDPDGYPVDFYYNVQNNTDRNYEFNPATLTLMAVLTDGNALSKDFGHYQSGAAVIDGPAFIPPGGTARMDLRVSYLYPDDFTQADKGDAKKIIPHLGRRVHELNGFVVFDNQNHFRIDLSKGWNDSDFEGNERKPALQSAGH
jgi:hypothetical protein